MHSGASHSPRPACAAASLLQLPLPHCNLACPLPCMPQALDALKQEVAALLERQGTAALYAEQSSHT